ELQREAGNTLLFGLGFAAIFGLVIGYASGPTFGLMVFAMIGLIALATSGRELLLGSSSAAGRMVDVYVSGDFVLANNQYSRLHHADRFGSGWNIASIALLPTTPAILEITSHGFRSRTLGAMAGVRGGIEGVIAGAVNTSGGPPIIVRVPVPPDRKAEAETLIARFIKDRGAKAS
ncbi:MAG TPA: hypothetical protein PK264_13655, partial [Hyphomicrobiaceae bacterium]|nr:hypothetical protein [Hyphomicrobiaceae bacterium]